MTAHSSAVAAACMLAGLQAQAAPLDSWLSADRPSALHRPVVEAGYDLANRSVDVLGLRPKRADGSSGPAGDYRGGHLLAGINVTPALWLDAGLWKRSIRYVSASTDVTTWTVAGQWLLAGGTGEGPQARYALRAGVWGNEAPLLRRTTSTVVQGTTFATAQATRPRDVQLQLDALGTWGLTPSLAASAFLGAGLSRVDFDSVSATTNDKNGCAYDVQFIDQKVVATCSAGGIETRISTSASVYGIDVDREARYSARYVQFGGHAAWRPADWRLRLGLQHIRVSRGAVDGIVLTRGGKVFRSNTLGLAEIGYATNASVLAFVRAQVMAHQFVGEAPLMYNTLTATQHRRRYGFVSLGLAGSF